MAALQNKIDFAVVFEVTNANPNGDPLNGNRPRTNYENVGEVTDVCLKRKMRDRLMEDGHAIFVQSDDRKRDDATSLRDRAEKNLGKKLDSPGMAKQACEKWLDVRAFGQLFAFKATGSKKGKAKEQEEGNDDAPESGVSIGVRGPVTVQSAFSLNSIDITSVQITKSVSGEDPKAGKTRASDTMGMKHRVDHGIYKFFGSMNPQLAERPGFSAVDSDAIKKVLPRMFENDASSARPEGTMRVLKVVWWKHNSKAGQYSSARVHDSLEVKPDGTLTLKPLPGLVPEEIPGF
jgi:CRISPR-associated protein Csd2